MLRYELRSVVQSPLKLGGIVLGIALWFFLEASSVNIPNLNMPIELLNIAWGENFATIEEFTAAFKAEHIPGLIAKLGWDTSGISWVIPALAATLLASGFTSGSTAQALSRGTGQIRLWAVKVIGFYLCVFVMQVYVLWLHILRLWPYLNLEQTSRLFLWIFLLHSIYACGFAAPTVLIAFGTQSVFLTAAIDYAYLIVAALAFQDIASRAWFPLTYLSERSIWQEFNTSLAQKGCLVSFVWIAVFSALSLLVFLKRDIRKN